MSSSPSSSFFGRFSTWVYWEVWKAAQCPFIKWWRPALHHRILADHPFGEWRGKIKMYFFLLFFVEVNQIAWYCNKHCKWIVNLYCLGCGIPCQRPSGGQKLYLLTCAARLYKGYQYPLALPPHQHPARPPHLQGPERPHRYTQGETHWTTSHYGVMLAGSCFPFGLCSTHLPACFLLKQAHRPAHMFTCVETHCQVCLLSIIWVILVISLIQSSVQDCAKHLSYSSFFYILLPVANISPGFLKICHSVSLNTGWFFTYFQSSPYIWPFLGEHL